MLKHNLLKLAVGFDDLLKRGMQVFNQLLSRGTLGVDAWDFLNPADPPEAVALNQRSIFRCHEIILASRAIEGEFRFVWRF